MREQLIHLEQIAKPIRVAIVGCGRFGSMMLSQILRTPGMDVAVACDIDKQRVVNAMLISGYDVDNLVTTSKVSLSNTAIRTRRPVITEDSDVAIKSDVDVVVEATGNPDIGAKHAFDAIAEGKHVVMVNVEADVLVGLALKDMADKSNVVYSLAYGDQPAVIEELYDWAVSMGFEIIAAGKGTKYAPEYRRGTPDDALIRYGCTPMEIKEGNLNPKMYNSFLDGTKSAVEMCAVSNMTGLVPDVPGMHIPPASIDEIPSILIPEKDGGILGHKGIVEIVSSVYPDGTAVPNSLRWGIYVVLTSDSAYLRGCLREYGMAMDASGTYGVMYRPYHLVGMEAPLSIAKAYLYGEPTGAPNKYVGEVVAAARRDLGASEKLDGEGGYTVYGVLVKAADARADDLLPIGLCHGARLKGPVRQDEMISCADVDMPEGSFARQLRDAHVGYLVSS